MNKKKLGFAGKLASLFLKNKQLGFLSIVVLLFWGILSFVLMPKQYNPEIVAPAFNVVTDFPGANSNEVYQLITRPMENKLKELSKVDKIMSQSFDGGKSVVMVQFLIGENLEDAKISLMQKLESNMEFKPFGANDPQIKEINPDDIPILTLAFSSKQYSPESLRKVALDVGDKIKHVEGVSKLDVRGGATKQLSVVLDEDKLILLGVSVNQVFDSIKNNNIRVFAGNIEGESNNNKIVVVGTIQNEKELGKIVVTETKEGAVLVSDVANVSYDIGKVESFANFSTKEHSEQAVFLGIAKLKGSNATTVSKNVINEMDSIKKQFLPEEVNFEIVRDDGEVAKESIGGLTNSLLLAVGVVSFVLFLFLGWRNAVVVAITIPLTLAAVFGLGNLFGQTVNRITLFALILSLGLLVDSATVVVENIYRFHKKKKTISNDNEDLIIAAVDEVGVGLTMSTITTILAFIPMAFISGMMGPYMGPIPFFVPAALVISLIIAFTVNPFLMNFFLKGSDDVVKRNVFLEIIEKIKNLYIKTLTKLLNFKKLRRKVLVLVFVLLVISLSLPVFKVVKFRMLPKADREQFFIYLDLPAFANIGVTRNLVSDVEKLLISVDNIESVQSYVGQSQIVDFNGLFKGSDGRVGENQATLKVNLTHPDKRKPSSSQIVLGLRDSLLQKMENFPDAKLKIIEDPPGPPVLSTFLIKIQGENSESLAKIAQDIENAASNIEEVVDIDTTVQERNLEYALRLNLEEVGKVGLSVTQIASTLSAILGDTKIGLFHETEKQEFAKKEQEFITVSFEQSDFDQKLDLEKISILNGQGEKVALSKLMSWEKVEESPIIFSDDRKKTAYVSAEMGDRSVTYGMIDMFKFLLDYRLPSGSGKIENISLWGFDFKDMETNETFNIVLDGEWKLTLEVFCDLGIAMAIAIFLIYFVLVAQFASLKVPVLVMGTIPLALIGVMPGFALLGFTKGIYFNSTSMIGVIALFGIVVNNAIIFLEYLEGLRKEGIEYKIAILRAGKTRLLPILLTSMTTVLGSLTIINDPVWAGLSWAIIWGLSLSAFLTLIIFPILLVEFNNEKTK